MGGPGPTTASLPPGDGHVRARAVEIVVAKEGLNSAAFEDLFNRAIETPVSQFLHAALGTDAFARLPVPRSGRAERAALYALCMTQAARIHDAHSNGSGFDELSRLGVSFDHVVAYAEQQFELVSVRTGPRHPLFFTEAAAFPVPVVGAPPALVTPLSPHHGVGLLDRGADRQGFGEVARAPGVLTALSVGVGTRVTRLVVPPSMHDAARKSPDRVAAKIAEWRDQARVLFDGVGLACLAVRAAIPGRGSDGPPADDRRVLLCLARAKPHDVATSASASTVNNAEGRPAVVNELHLACTVGREGPPTLLDGRCAATLRIRTSWTAASSAERLAPLARGRRRPARSSAPRALHSARGPPHRSCFHRLHARRVST